MLDLHARRDSALEPVADSLHAALLLVQAEKLGDFGRASQAVDDDGVGVLGLVHGVLLNTMFSLL